MKSNPGGIRRKLFVKYDLPKTILRGQEGQPMSQKTNKYCQKF